MKKIGILFGKERSFPEAFVERINSKNIDGITAEPVHEHLVMPQGGKRSWSSKVRSIAPAVRRKDKDAASAAARLHP